MNQIVILRKKWLLLFLILGLTATTTQAQLGGLTGAKSPNAGGLLKQFAGALKPTSFLSSWASGGKANWLSAASKVTDAVGMASSISSLTGFIKPDMFKQGFNVSTITQAASAVKTYSDASGLLKSLEGGLKPAAFLSSWATKRPAFMTALNLLK
ncbi:hypothetical protein Q4E93_22545 [Flavitalea sp. BT771]|uniref:hypothetical protein n=1 Tax=Flavitalea sp. BT771 TaxID=3063329 RepID=UPI0026E3030B|nr:hypothetical protein [Flavitalea sp. BT771]MDO6433409.1 hypothetical protein [Flavitalea sp. BT771]MDV6222686.1 hypothetical protein [Flavitalea sp. BT771]